MGKKKFRYEPDERSVHDIVSREVQGMRHRDLQRACVMRGMPFKEVVEATDPDLINWFTKHYHEGQDMTRLPEFDAWVDSELKRVGVKDGDPLFHSSLKLGYFKADDIEDSELKPKKNKQSDTEKPIKEKKDKRVKDEETGMVKGTKKALTYQCCREGLSVADTLTRVLESFPEAQPKSITIWFKRCQKELKG